MNPHSRWLSLSPIPVSSPDDLTLEVTFRGPKVTMSTPIIESFEVTLLLPTPQYLSYSID